jgi:hypothetical protein
VPRRLLAFDVGVCSWASSKLTNVGDDQVAEGYRPLRAIIAG